MPGGHDPNPDTTSSEASVAAGDQGSLLFLETTRDAGTRSTDWPVRVAPHELGHQFSLPHPKKGTSIMTVSGPLAFSPKQLNVLRWRVHSPGL